MDGSTAAAVELQPVASTSAGSRDGSDTDLFNVGWQLRRRSGTWFESQRRTTGATQIEYRFGQKSYPSLGLCAV